MVGYRSSCYDSSMAIDSEISLSCLRQIGWKLWDPIGLAPNGSAPDEGCVDEYDRYLLHVVGMISSGRSEDEATAYLIGIESEAMGMSFVNAQAAAATSHAIVEYVTSLANGPKTVR